MQSVTVTRASIFTLLVSASAIAGGNHHICYQGAWQGNLQTVVVQCRSDVPGVTCSVSLPRGSFTTPPVGTGTVAAFTVPSAAAYEAQIRFSDGTTRHCSTTTNIPFTRSGSALASARSADFPALVGYTTDASGLLTTGVWRSQTHSPSSLQANIVTVPGDFVVVGGGGTGAEVPYGALLSAAAPTGDSEKREWSVRTEDAFVAQAHDNETFAIGMKVEGLNNLELRNLVTILTSGGTGPSSVSTGRAVPAIDTVVLGGGAAASDIPSISPFGQYLTKTAPEPFWVYCLPGVSPRGCQAREYPAAWLSASKDHGTSRPGIAVPWITTMPNQFTMDSTGRRYTVDVWMTEGVSAVAAHPAVTVAGRRGEYALTGIGASVNWQSAGAPGNLIWKLVPRADIAGVEAASKDHVYSSPATITGYTLGMKLIPLP